MYVEYDEHLSVRRYEKSIKAAKLQREHTTKQPMQLITHRLSYTVEKKNPIHIFFNYSVYNRLICADTREYESQRYLSTHANSCKR